MLFRSVTTLDQQGEELILQWSFVPFYEGPDLKYRIAFGYDITPLKRVEREIIRLNEELEAKVDKRTRSLKESNEQLAKAYDNLKVAQQTLVESEKMASLGSLVAGVAHEINTPVGISVTAASFLQERIKDFQSKIDDKQLSRSYLTELIHTLDESTSLLQNNLRRASDLISSFKQVAVDQSSQAHYQFNVADNLHQVVVSLGHKLKKSQTEVEIQCDPKLTVLSYPGSFAQIYSNLILNSIRHGFEDWDQPKRIDINATIIPCMANGEIIPNLYLVPADISLSRIIEQSLTQIHRERILMRHLEKLQGQFDIILLDCPPNLSLTSTNAMMAAEIGRASCRERVSSPV